MSRCEGSTGADLKYSHSQEMTQFGPEMCQNNSSMTPTMKHMRITEYKRVEMKVGKALLASSGRLLAPPVIIIWMKRCISREIPAIESLKQRLLVLWAARKPFEITLKRML